MLNRYKTPLLIGLGLILTYLIIFPDVKYDQYFTDEDSWVENISALAFLIAAILFFRVYLKSSGKGLKFGQRSMNRNLVFLFLGLLFFVAFGEEISWGQRIFGWSTPENLAKINYQQETNIHNLDFFTFKDETGDGFWSSLLVFNAGRIFFYFWFSYLVILPLCHYFFEGFRKFIEKIRFPIAPLWIGFLMIFNLVLSKVYKILTSGYPEDYAGSIDEVMENNYAVIIAILAIWFVRNNAFQSSAQLKKQPKVIPAAS